MPQTKSRGKRRSRKNGRSMAMTKWIPHPPAYVANLIVHRRFRFTRSYQVNAGLETYNISPAKIGQLVGICTTVNSVITGLFEQAIIHRVEMWASPPTDGSQVYVSCICNGNTYGLLGADKTFSDVTIGMTEPAYVKNNFRALSAQSGQPQPTNSTNNTTWFTLNINGRNPNAANSVVAYVTIDIVGTFFMSNDARNANNTNSIVNGLALTSLVYLALDNTGGGNLSQSNLLLPDPSLVTIT